MSEIVTRDENKPPALPVEQVLAAIIGAAKDPNVDVGKMQQLLALQKDLMAMQAEQQFNAAYQRIRHDLPRIKRNGTVEYKGKEAFKFATWEAISAVIDPILDREGMWLSFDSEPRTGDGGGIIITGTLSHIAGHSKKAKIPLALDNSGGKNSIQGMGSTFSYGKRYTATALLNIITEGEDDDGRRGGEKFIDDAQVAELKALCEQANRKEDDFMQSFSAGSLHTFDELEPGTAFLAARGALARMARAKGST